MTYETVSLFGADQPIANIRLARDHTWEWAILCSTWRYCLVNTPRYLTQEARRLAGDEYLARLESVRSNHTLGKESIQ
jgi:hypothetical protein